MSKEYNVDDDKFLIETTKHYKMTIKYAFYKIELSVESSNTIEIIKEEYDSFQYSKFESCYN